MRTEGQRSAHHSIGENTIQALNTNYLSSDLLNICCTCPTSAFLWLTFLIHIRKTIVIEIWCQNINFFLKLLMEFGRNCHYFRCHLITNYLLLILWYASMICYLKYCCNFSAGKLIGKMSIAIFIACDHNKWIFVVKQRFSYRLYLIWLCYLLVDQIQLTAAHWIELNSKYHLK